MFNFKRALQKVFGRETVKPRKAASVISITPLATPQVTIDDARRSLLEVLKAAEEKKRSELPDAMKRFFDQLNFACFSSEAFDDDYYSACKQLGFSRDRVKSLIDFHGIAAFAAAVWYFSAYPECDLNERLLPYIHRAFSTLETRQYTFCEGVEDYESLGMEIAGDQIPDQFASYVDYERIGEDFSFDLNGQFVPNGFFAPQEF